MFADSPSSSKGRGRGGGIYFRDEKAIRNGWQSGKIDLQSGLDCVKENDEIRLKILGNSPDSGAHSMPGDDDQSPFPSMPMNKTKDLKISPLSQPNSAEIPKEKLKFKTCSTIPFPRIPTATVRTRFRYDFNRKFENCLQYEFPSQDSCYKEMAIELNQFYRYHRGHEDICGCQNQHLLKAGSIVVVQDEVERDSKKGFRRAKLLTDLRNDEAEAQNYAASVSLVDEDSSPFVVLLRNIYLLVKNFAMLPPRLRFASLENLSLYAHMPYFGAVVQSIAADSFSGKLQGTFIKNDSADEDLKFHGHCSVVITGPPYIHKLQFPLGLNGFLVSVLIDTFREPLLPKLHMMRLDTKLLGIEKDGNANIGFYTPMYEHLEEIIEKLNNPDLKWSKKIKEASGNVTPKVGEMYLAPYSKDGCFYRAMYQPEKNDAAVSHPSDEVQINFIDYNNTEFVKIDKLAVAKYVDPWLPLFPPQAMTVKLAGVTKLKVSGWDEILDVSGYFKLKVLMSPKGSLPATVEMRRLVTDPSSPHENLNEEIVALFGDGDTGRAKKFIQSLRCSVVLNPIELENPHATKRCFVSLRTIFWNRPTEPLVIFQADKEFDVFMSPAEFQVRSINLKEPNGCIVLLPPKRLYLRDKIEARINKRMDVEWSSHRIREYASSARNVRTWGCRVNMITEKDAQTFKFVRVQVMEDWESLQHTIHLYDGIQMRVFLIDYGYAQEVTWRDLFILDDEELACPPLAIEASIEVLNKAAIKANSKVICDVMGGSKKVHRVLVKSIHYNAFGLPHAVIEPQFLDETSASTLLKRVQERQEKWENTPPEQVQLDASVLSGPFCPLYCEQKFRDKRMNPDDQISF